MRESTAREGESPVCSVRYPRGLRVKESCTLILVHKAGDKLLLRLNISRKPIANKYCEGKMKSNLKRMLKDLKPLRRKR